MKVETRQLCASVGAVISKRKQQTFLDPNMQLRPGDKAKDNSCPSARACVPHTHTHTHRVCQGCPPWWLGL